MIIGAHVTLYSKDAEADRRFLRDILKLNSVDAGGGWLIFAMPRTEAAVHPANANDKHELYFVVDDIHAMVAELKTLNVACSPLHEEDWGTLTRVTLPGGGQLGMYQARHAHPA